LEIEKGRDSSKAATETPVDTFVDLQKLKDWSKDHA